MKVFLKKIMWSAVINVLLLTGFGLLPCTSSGILDLCSDGWFQPMWVLVALAMQIGIIFGYSDPKYFVSIGFDNSPNFMQFVMMWAVILSPFYFDRIRRKLTRMKN